MYNYDVQLLFFSFLIVQEWCTKWQIHVQLSDIKGEESILDDLHNLCDNTKMFAIASVAQLARHRAIIKSKSSLRLSSPRSRSNNMMNSPVMEVTVEMVNALQKLLEDHTEHVRVPSAILLYCIDKQCKKVTTVTNVH